MTDLHVSFWAPGFGLSGLEGLAGADIADYLLPQSRSKIPLLNFLQSSVSRQVSCGDVIVACPKNCLPTSPGYAESLNPLLPHQCAQVKQSVGKLEVASSSCAFLQLLDDRTSPGFSFLLQP